MKTLARITVLTTAAVVLGLAAASVGLRPSGYIEWRIRGWVYFLDDG